MEPDDQLIDTGAEPADEKQIFGGNSEKREAWKLKWNKCSLGTLESVIRMQS